MSDDPCRDSLDASAWYVRRPRDALPLRYPGGRRRNDGGQVVGRLTAVGRGLAAIGLISEERN